MGGAEGLVELGMAELGDGWSVGGFLFFPELLFFIPMVYFLRFNSILLCAAIMVNFFFR